MKNDGAMTESNAIARKAGEIRHMVVKHHAIIREIVGERSAKGVNDILMLISFLEERCVRGNGPD